MLSRRHSQAAGSLRLLRCRPDVGECGREPHIFTDRAFIGRRQCSTRILRVRANDQSTRSNEVSCGGPGVADGRREISPDPAAHEEPQPSLVRLLRQARVRPDRAATCWAWRSTSSTARPRPDDAITVGMVDLQDGDRWIELGESRAWCWQQGCMLQWLPGSQTEVIWNDRQDGRFVCHILDVTHRQARTLPRPVYALSPDGRWAVAPDFRRLHDTRPGYGYAGIPDPNRDGAAPDDAGIWRVDLAHRQARPACSRSRRSPSIPSPRRRHDGRQALVQPPARLARTAAGSSSCTAGGASRGQVGFTTRMFTADAGRHGPPRARPATARPRTSSGATRSTSWPGPGTPRTATSSTSTRTGPTGSKWSART